MRFKPNTSGLAALVLVSVLVCLSGFAHASTVTLRSLTSPTSGQPGSSVIGVLGSNFPSGTISPANVTVTLHSSAGGAAVTTTATAVAVILGTAERVSFIIPASISVSSPTNYLVTISGTSNTGVSFTSGNSATLTVNPSPKIVSISPSTANAGQALNVNITGSSTTFTAGVTQINLGAGISITGPLQIGSFTSIVAPIQIDPAATAGPRDLTVTTGSQQLTLSAAFVVNVTNLPPVASPGGPYSGTVGTAVQFDGSASSDPDGDNLSYQWDFGDHSTSTGTKPTHSYSTKGTYTVSLLVDDGHGLTNSSVTTATITQPDTTPPGVTITSPTSLQLFNQSTITVTGIAVDPDDSSVTLAVNGVNATFSGTTFTASGVPLKEGSNTVTAAATDAAGNVGTASVTVQVDTTPPTIAINAPSAGAMVTSSSITVSGVVNDAVTGTVNGGDVTVTVNGLPAAVSNRSFQVMQVPLTLGLNTIAAIATDKAGNQSQTQVQVNLVDATSQQHLSLVSGDGQSAPINTLLGDAGNPLVVQLLDANNTPLANHDVTFSVTRSDGTVQSLPQQGRAITVQTDKNGQASVLFQVGTRVGAGINQVTVTSPGAAGEVIFSETSTPGPPNTLNIVSGDHQTGTTGENLPAPFVVIVFDAGGNPLSAQLIAFTVNQGDASFGGTSSLTATTDSNGRAAALLTLGQQEGINNDSVQVTVNGTQLSVGFTASAMSAKDPLQTSVSGVVLDNANTPIPNAKASIVGTALSALSDAQGRFKIAGAPVGNVTLLVDGTSSTRPETFPMLNFQLTTIAGQDNTVGGPIFLPPIDTQSSQIVGGDQDVVLTMSGVPGYQFTVFAHSVTFADGSHVGRMSLSQVHSDKVPMAPPNGTSPRLAGTLQPPGAHFDPPIKVQFPNVDSLAPGTVVDIYSYDHDQEQFVSQGPGRVSADASVIVSDPGFGITKSGWHFGPPPPPPKNCVASCGACKKCIGALGVGVCLPNPGALNNACNDSCTVNGRCTLIGTCSGNKKQVLTVTATADGKSPNDLTAVSRNVNFSAAATSQFCNKLIYTWDFGDGMRAIGQNVTHAYAMTGTFTATVTVDCDVCLDAEMKAQVNVNVAMIKSITATIPSTPTLANLMFMSTQQIPMGPLMFSDATFAQPNALVLIQSGTAQIPLAVAVEPAATDVSFDVQRDPADAAGLGAGVPPVSKTGQTMAQLTPDRKGSFQILAYLDLNGNGKRDDDEPGITLPLVIVEVTLNQNLSIAHAANLTIRRLVSGGVWIGEAVSTGTFNPGAPDTAGMYLAAQVDFVGGGPNGQRGIDRVYAGWIQNETAAENVGGDYANHHATNSVFASNHASATGGDPQNPVFLPGDPAPVVVATPLLDSGFGAAAGMGGGTATLTRSRISKTPTNLPLGQRRLIEAVDSPGQPYEVNDPGFAGSVLQSVRFNLDFRAYLSAWTNVDNPAKRDVFDIDNAGAASGYSVGATNDPAERSYFVVLEQPWTVRGQWTVDAMGNPTALASLITAGAATTRSPVVPAMQVVIPPTGTSILSTDAQH